MIKELLKDNLITLIPNRRAVMFAVAHWMTVVYLAVEGLTNKPNHLFGGYDDNRWQIILSISILIVDLPAILSAALLWSPMLKFVNYHIFLYGVIFISIFTVTLEWLIIDKIVFNIFSSFESRMTTLSLKDD